MSQNQFTIRPAVMDDAPQMDAMLTRSYPKLLANDYTAETLAVAIPLMAVTRPALLDDQTYFVAERAGVIIGAGGWTRVVPGQDVVIPGRGNIRRLIVDVGQVRSGIARALMAHTHDSAAQASMTEMYVLSTRTAVPFYEAVGYTVLRGVDVSFGDTGVIFPSVEMSRRF